MALTRRVFVTTLASVTIFATLALPAFSDETDDASENPAMQGSVNVTTDSGLSGIDVAAAASESFDEALTKDQVRAIVQPFFIPTIPA